MMACANQLHQTIFLTQTESDDEEIDVITVDVHEKALSQDLECALLSKIEFKIDSDSDEFIDVVTVFPAEHTSSKVQVNKSSVSKSRLTLSQTTANGLSKTKLNNNSEEKCFTMKTSKRTIDKLDNDWDDEILRMYTSKRKKDVHKGSDPETQKNSSMFQKTSMKCGKVTDDHTSLAEKRIEPKSEKNSKGLVGTDVRSNIGSGKVKSTKKNLGKSVSQTSTSKSRSVVDKRSRRINNHETESVGNRAALDNKDKEQAQLLKPKRKCTQKSFKYTIRKNN